MSSSEIAKLLQPETPKKESASKHSASQIRKVANVNKQTSSWISPFRPTASKSARSPTKSQSTSSPVNTTKSLVSSTLKKSNSKEAEATSSATLDETEAEATLPPVTPVSATETALEPTASGNGQVVEDEEAIDQNTEKGIAVEDAADQTTIEEEPLNAEEPVDSTVAADETVDETDDEVIEVTEQGPAIVDSATTEEPSALVDDKEIDAEEQATSESKKGEAVPVQEVFEEEEPVDLSPPKKDAVEEAYASKPKMLNRYIENKSIVNSAMNKNSVENPTRVLDLGAGLKLTEAQIYELARKRVAPILKNVDQSVSENLARDKVKADAEEAKIVQKDEKKMEKQLNKYKVRIEKENVDIKKKFELDMKETENKMKLSEKAAEKYIQDVKTGISNDAEDGELNEERAAADHITNKEKTIKNAEEFKDLKISALKDAVDQQVVEKEKIKQLQTDGTAFEKEAEDLEAKLSEKELELQEKLKKLEELLGAKSEKDTLIRSAIKEKKISERNLAIINQKHERASSNHVKLQDHLALLTTTIGAHSTKINDLKTTGKETLATKRATHTKAAADWEEEVQQIRIEEARKQERLRIEAEEERKRIEKEKAAEELRLKEEKAAEELKIKEEKAAEELRLKEQKAAEEEKARLAKIAEEEQLAKQKEEELKLAELKRKEQLAESKRLEEEVKELEKLKTLKIEKERLSKELAALAGAGAVVAAGTAALVGSSAGAATNAAGSTLSGTSKVISSSVPAASTGTVSSSTPTKFPTSARDVSEPIHEHPEEHSDTPETQPTPSRPLQRRKSMVDDALKHLSPEEQVKMNRPLSEQMKEYAEKRATDSRNNSLTGKNPIASSSRSNSLTRSSSFVKKFKPRSRSNSLKASSAPIASAAVSGTKPKTELSSSKANAAVAAATASVAAAVAVTSLDDKTEKPDVKEIDTAANKVEPSILVVPASNSSKDVSSTSSIRESAGTAEKVELKEIKAVPIFTKAPSSFELLEPETVPTTADSKPDSGDDLDSLEAKRAIAAKPVFTEEVVAATDKANIESDYEEVVSLVTVDSAEYNANKDNPNYIVIAP